MHSAPEGVREFGVTRENEERRDGGFGIIYDPATSRFAVGKDSTTGQLRFFAGGVEEGEDITEGILREVREESGLHDFAHQELLGEAFVHYHNALKNVNRVAHATCLLLILRSTDLVQTHLEAHETFSLAWATEGELRADLVATNGNHNHDHWIYFFDRALERIAALA